MVRIPSPFLLVPALALSLSCGVDSGDKVCDSSTCSGCCDLDGKCQSGMLTTACGAAGAACSACATGQVCAGGACFGGDPGATGGTDGGDADGGGGTVTGCGPGTAIPCADGCCAGTGASAVCVAGTTVAQCGKGGTACKACNTSPGMVCSAQECAVDACGSNGCSVDSDGDGIPDIVEGRCQATPPDSDHDGTPDYLDLDSDGDLIPDAVEWRGGGCDPTTAKNDTDQDGLPDFRDLDSDNDSVSDRCEARGKPMPDASDLNLAVLDTDGDGKPDYLDTDSDGDLLADGAEDANRNCRVDACETNRTKKDTDSDGVDDFIEVSVDTTGQCWATDGHMNPAKAGKFYFVVPYSATGTVNPTPTQSPLALTTAINQGDVGFIVDTTGSMGGTITGLKSSLSSTIIPALKAAIPNLGVGVAAHDDFPYSDFGDSGDSAFYSPLQPQGYVTTVTSDSQAAANALSTHSGSDGPESQIPAMYKAITGVALTWPGGSLAADAPAPGTFGAMRFRSSALPIIINATDVTGHNGRHALDATGTSYSPALTDPYSFTTYDVDNLVTQMTSTGARFIGACADNGNRCFGGTCCYSFHAYIADKTGSLAPPSAFTHTSACPAGQCCTGVSGAGIPPDGPTVGGVQQCRLVFSYDSGGTGLSTSIVDGVYALLGSLSVNVYVQAETAPLETTDVVGNFMLSVEPNSAGGIDPVTGGACATIPANAVADDFIGPKAVTPGSDGLVDTIQQVNPGSLYCFKVTPKPNTTVVPTDVAQLFRARLKTVAVNPGGGTFSLGHDHEVLFVVPPVPPTVNCPPTKICG